MERATWIKRLASAALVTAFAGASYAETWTTTGSGSGWVGSLTFESDNDDHPVTIRGFRQDQVSGTTYSRNVQAWSNGIGVRGGVHAIDNRSWRGSIGDYRYLDLITLDFGSTLRTITDITLTAYSSWGGNDKDSELWAFTGESPATSPTGNYSSWGTQGWERVDYWNAIASNGATTFNNDGNPSVQSTLWAVVAKSSDTYRDVFKFTGFSATKPSGGSGEVPVPGTLTLLTIGALAVRWKLAKA